jgi:uroporphyrinogen-III synthase
VAPESSRQRLQAALRSTRRPHAITFTSSSTVKNFVGLLGLRAARAVLKKSGSETRIHSASIGPVTSATLREFGLPVDIEAREFTIPGLVAAIQRKSEAMRASRR